MGFWIFKHGSAYQAIHIEVVKIDPQVLKIRMSPTFKGTALEEEKFEIDLTNEEYWETFASELAQILLDSLNLPIQDDYSENLEANYNQVAPSPIENREIDEEKYPILPGDWLITPIDEHVAEKMATMHGLGLRVKI